MVKIMTKCLDCGKKLSDSRSKRCKKCNNIYLASKTWFKKIKSAAAKKAWAREESRNNIVEGIRKKCLKYDKILTMEFSIDEYVNKNKTSLDIAKKVNCSPRTVLLYLYQHKIEIKKNVDYIEEKWKGKDNPKYKHGLNGTKEYIKMQNSRRRARFKKGGKLKVETVQRIYEENIKEFGTLTCVYCFNKLTFGKDVLEHVVPLSREGTNKYSNLVVSCNKCNASKSNKLLKEWIK